LSKDRIKVLITDDSPVVREVLKDMIEDEPDLDIVGEASNGREAVNMAKELCPDIITMDVLMPVMNGLEAVEEIMAYNPTPILVFSSALDDKEMDVAFQAIARGALDVMEKPKVPSGEKYDQIRLYFLEKIRMLSNIQVIPHLRGKRRKSGPARRDAKALSPSTSDNHPLAAKLDTIKGKDVSRRRAEAVPESIPEPEVSRYEPEIMDSTLIRVPAADKVGQKIVAIGSSTGGPKALVQIFRRIPETFPLPVLSVQHIAPSFASGLVSWLNRESPLLVVLGEDKTRPTPGILYVAPTGVHMILEKGLIRLTEDPPVNSCRPSVDVLFLSLAESIGERTVGVLLTGMGRDGARGLKAIKEKKGRTLIQDESTSVIFGMPKAAMDLGAENEVVPLHNMPEAIARSIV
jgi:two-component system chemotaxis response regulator CheB